MDNSQDIKKLKELLDRVGREYIPAMLPFYIERGSIGDCYDHCAVMAFKHNLTYVEGLVYLPHQEEVIAHAWLTDGKHAYDPIFKALDDDGNEHPMPAIYLGMPVDKKLLVKFLKRTGYKSVFGNGWRAPELLDEIIEEGKS